MSKRRKSSKISIVDKVTISAVSLLGVIGGWNLIGHVEKTASADKIASSDPPTPIPPAVQPTPTPWPTIQALKQIPRLKIEPLPTLSASDPVPENSGLTEQVNRGTGESFALSSLPSAAPMPTLAPLPTLPEYVPPPPPPPPKPSNGGGGSGGSGSSGNNKSSGS